MTRRDTQSEVIGQSGEFIFPAVALETRLIVQLILDTKINEVIEFNDFKRICGYTCQAGKNQKGYGYLQSARKICERRGIYLISEKGTGYRVADDSGKLNLTDAYQKRGGRSFRKSLAITAAIDEDNLSENEKTRMMARMSIAGVVMDAMKPNTMKLLQKEERVIPSNEVLDMFRKSGRA